jgi:hypothetical protein
MGHTTQDEGGEARRMRQGARQRRGPRVPDGVPCSGSGAGCIPILSDPGEKGPLTAESSVIPLIPWFRLAHSRASLDIFKDPLRFDPIRPRKTLGYVCPMGGEASFTPRIISRFPGSGARPRRGPYPLPAEAEAER